MEAYVPLIARYGLTAVMCLMMRYNSGARWWWCVLVPPLVGGVAGEVAMHHIDEYRPILWPYLLGGYLGALPVSIVMAITLRRRGSSPVQGENPTTPREQGQTAPH